MEKPNLQTCPSCHQLSLMLDTKNDRYECLNLKCKHTFLPVLIERYNQQIEDDRKALEELSNAKTRAWVGNQYYDDKKKKWRDGDKPTRIHRIPSWIWLVLAFVLISLIITLILNYSHPGSHFIIFGW